MNRPDEESDEEDEYEKREELIISFILLCPPQKINLLRFIHPPHFKVNCLQDFPESMSAAFKAAHCSAAGRFHI